MIFSAIGTPVEGDVIEPDAGEDEEEPQATVKPIIRTAALACMSRERLMRAAIAEHMPVTAEDGTAEIAEAAEGAATAAA
jgi:hypothetical protein